MSFSDLLFGIALIAYAVIPDTDSTEQLMRLLPVAQTILVSVSLYHLSMLSIMGYQAIKNPLSYRNFMMNAKCKMTVFCGVAWFIPVLTSLIIFLPKFNDGENGKHYKPLSDIWVVSYSMIPYLITVVGTLLMYQAYRKDKFRNQRREKSMEVNTVATVENSAVEMNPQLRMQQINTHKNFAKMITLIFFGYSVTCLPYFMNVILFTAFPKFGLLFQNYGTLSIL